MTPKLESLIDRLADLSEPGRNGDIVKAIKQEIAQTNERWESALTHIKNLTEGEVCSYGMVSNGESCIEYLSRTQGVPMAGCSHCEALEFLKKRP